MLLVSPQSKADSGGVRSTLSMLKPVENPQDHHYQQYPLHCAIVLCKVNPRNIVIIRVPWEQATSAKPPKKQQHHQHPH